MGVQRFRLSVGGIPLQVIHLAEDTYSRGISSFAFLKYDSGSPLSSSGVVPSSLPDDGSSYRFSRNWLFKENLEYRLKNRLMHYGIPEVRQSV